MKIETLKKDNKKKIGSIIIAVISITLVGIFVTSFAKYKLTESIPLAEGVINYKAYDFKIMAMYQQKENSTCTEDNCYDEIETMPKNGYAIDETKSYCTIDNKNKDTKAILKTENGKHIISSLSKNDKCYLYFDKIIDDEKPLVSKIEVTEVTKVSITVRATATDNAGVISYLYSINNGTYTETTENIHTFSGLTKGTNYTIKVKVKDAAGNESDVKTETIATQNDKASETILSGITVKEPIEFMFASVATTDEGIFKAEDNDGTSYYYRGAVTNNYLTFAGKWWRIIRINGDGTIRIIYDGTEYHANGTSTTDARIGTSVFNSTYNNAIYVGFKYGTTSEGRGLTNKSTILSALETWYINNLASYASKIDTNAGFCGDRTAYTNAAGTTVGTGYGTGTQFFADYVRLLTNKVPVLTCANNADLYTISGSTKGNKSLEKPIGLINVNEVAMAGGVCDEANKKFYLFNGQSYWTMSPFRFLSGKPSMFGMTHSGYPSFLPVDNAYDVRPVINLRADVPITGSGTENDPFVVN